MNATQRGKKETYIGNQYTDNRLHSKTHAVDNDHDGVNDDIKQNRKINKEKYKLKKILYFQISVFIICNIIILVWRNDLP